MNLQFSKKPQLFVAYPWNIYVQSLYEEIFKDLFKDWDIRYGSRVTVEDKNISKIEQFLNRNKHLFDVFVSAISNCDFFIADVTEANPNVMLELGIAIQLNKNILIVTNDEHKKLPFDISSRSVSRYKDKEELKKIIKHELAIFKSIRSQTFDKYYKQFYYSFPAGGTLQHNKLLVLPLPKGIKNLRFMCEYKFLDISNSHDWFGIHLRTQEPFIAQSELVYVRSNLKLESVTFPGRRIPQVGKEKDGRSDNEGEFKKIEILLVENSLRAETPDYLLEDDNVINENLGTIALHVFAHDSPTHEKLNIEYRNIRIISLDTTSPLY